MSEKLYREEREWKIDMVLYLKSQKNSDKKGVF